MKSSSVTAKAPLLSTNGLTGTLLRRGVLRQLAHLKHGQLVVVEITQAQDADFVTGRFSSVDISVREGGTKAIGGRVAENDQNALTHGDKF